MNMKLLIKLCSGFMAVVTGCALYCFISESELISMMPKIETSAEVRALFPTSPEDIAQRAENACIRASQDIASLLALKPEDRTFANTVQALDSIGAQLSVVVNGIYVMGYVHPDAAMRGASQQSVVKVQEFSVDHLSNNKTLYQVIKEYAGNQAAAENLNAEERRYLNETVKDFEKAGLGLPEKEQEEVKRLKKALAKMALEFGANINTDNSTLTVSQQELAGLDNDFIAGLKQDEAGNYVLGVDGPTVIAVLANCAVESTRRDLANLYNNRAHPVNSEILKKAIAFEDQKARLLGFSTFAHLNIEDQMAQTPEKVHVFLDDLAQRSEQKMIEEMELFKSNLPEGVTLTDKDEFKPWDLGYIKTQYKKEHLKLDEEKIKEYFPMQHTLDQLLDIYSQFFGLKFEQQALDGLWHQDTRYIKVLKKDGTLLGHLILDLHPRDNKYTHACEIDIVPASRTKNGELFPGVAIVLANFPKPQGDRPALLKRGDVQTFFHEFGHALHSLFGATQMVGFSGTSVPNDFVEVPSQMLEEWLYDKDILKKVSKHYITGEALSDEIIQKIQDIKCFDSGLFVQRQVGLARLSLACYAEGEDKDPYSIKKQIFEQMNKGYTFFNEQDHFEASFGHLLNYYSRYYCYLWSKVYALEMFEHIKKFGLLNHEIGKKYAEEVLGKGNSIDTNDLIKNFLGRVPSSDAFFADLGL